MIFSIPMVPQSPQMEKNQWILPALFLSMVVLFAFVKKQDIGSFHQENKTLIRGTVKPSNAALHVWAVSNTDTSSGVVVNGQFEIKNLKGGLYRVIAEGLRPYKVTTKTGVNVNPGSSVDVGEIVLEQ